MPGLNHQNSLIDKWRVGKTPSEGTIATAPSPTHRAMTPVDSSRCHRILPLALTLQHPQLPPKRAAGSRLCDHAASSPRECRPILYSRPALDLELGGAIPTTPYTWTTFSTRYLDSRARGRNTACLSLDRTPGERGGIWRIEVELFHLDADTGRCQISFPSRSTRAIRYGT